MFAVRFLDGRRGQDVIEGQNVYLRFPQAADYAMWRDLRLTSRDFLQPWEPVWSCNDLGRFAYKERLKRYSSDIRRGTCLPFFIFNQETDGLLGGLTLGHIKRGVSLSAQIGYWMGKPHSGQGYMREALSLSVRHAFKQCGLHRLEAACIPDNYRSIRLLLGAGFHKEGNLSAYLKINGQWRDHILFAQINPNTV